MSSDTSSPPNEKSKIERVREWLLKAGYPLELRTARAFSGPRFNRVVLGDVYRSEQDVLRDIDVAAQLGVYLHRPQAFEGRGVSMFLDLFTVCECKSNPKGHRPWIVFSDSQVSIEHSFRVRSHHASTLGRWLLNQVDQTSHVELFITPRVGYSVRCARLGDKEPRENDQDPAYEAVMAVIDAARAKADISSPGLEMFRVVLPLIVIDTDLYECRLDDRGDLRLEARDEMAMLWKIGPGLGATSHAMVYIVTESKLPDWVRRVEIAHQLLSADEELLKRGVLEIRDERMQRLDPDDEMP